MKIAVCASGNVFEPDVAPDFIETLLTSLRSVGHEVEMVRLPWVEGNSTLLQQMSAFRLIDVHTAEMVLSIGAPNHIIRHRNKVFWSIDRLPRSLVEGDREGEVRSGDAETGGLVEVLKRSDALALGESVKVFAGSVFGAEHIKAHYGRDTEVLYTPIDVSPALSGAVFNGELVCLGGLSRWRRQRLLVEALRHTKTDVRLRFCCLQPGSEYESEVLSMARGLGSRITFDDVRFTSSRKSLVLGSCLAVVHVPRDAAGIEPSVLEAACYGKPVLTTSDSGGVLELVANGITGFVSEPAPVQLAQHMDSLYRMTFDLRGMGENARRRVRELSPPWLNAIDRLLR